MATGSGLKRNLDVAMADLSYFAEQIGAPSDVRSLAESVYHQALERDLVRGRPIATVVAASLYAACRLSEHSTTIKQVALATKRTGERAPPDDRSLTARIGVSKKELARCYRILVNELSLEMPIDDPVKCVPRIAQKVKIDDAVQNRAISIINAARKRGFSTGKDPMGLAAAAIYTACVLERADVAGNREMGAKTQKSLADAANVTEVTVRSRFQDLKNVLDTPFDDPTKCVPAIAAKANINQQVQKRAIALINEAKSNGIACRAGRTTTVGLAAGALYVACRLEKTEKTQREIAAAANIHTSVVYNRCQDLKTRLKFNGHIGPSQA